MPDALFAHHPCTPHPCSFCVVEAHTSQNIKTTSGWYAAGPPNTARAALTLWCMDCLTFEHVLWVQAQKIIQLINWNNEFPQTHVCHYFMLCPSSDHCQWVHRSSYFSDALTCSSSHSNKTFFQGSQVLTPTSFSSFQYEHCVWDHNPGSRFIFHHMLTVAVDKTHNVGLVLFAGRLSLTKCRLFSHSWDSDRGDALEDSEQTIYENAQLNSDGLFSLTASNKHYE